MLYTLNCRFGMQYNVFEVFLSSHQSKLKNAYRLKWSLRRKKNTDGKTCEVFLCHKAAAECCTIVCFHINGERHATSLGNHRVFNYFSFATVQWTLKITEFRLQVNNGARPDTRDRNLSTLGPNECWMKCLIYVQKDRDEKKITLSWGKTV